MKEHFKHQLLNWYLEHQRSLPWRENSAPYSVWLSEIILQQTRVNQGLNYYNKFISKYPSIQDLAKAPLDDILKLWQGLGYYSRARNLHKCAQIIVNEHNATFPSTYKELLKLPGIGAYTAAAISSICFNEAQAVVDGNVYRVLARYFGIRTPIDSTQGKKDFQELANQLIPEDKPGDYNQAIMEFGALQCVPKSPDCSNCPLINSCSAYADGFIELLPIKEKKIKQRKRYFLYQLIEQEGEIAIEKRKNKDIWEGLYQLPLTELSSEKELQACMEQHYAYQSKMHKHQLSHQTIFAQLIENPSAAEKIKSNTNIIWIDKQDFTTFAVPKLVENLWTEYQNQVLE